MRKKKKKKEARKAVGGRWLRIMAANGSFYLISVFGGYDKNVTALI